MKNFGFISFFLQNLIMLLNIKYIHSNINTRELSTLACVKFENNICTKCKEGFELVNKHCYNIRCEVFGFCQYCDDYDCLKCKKGYKLNYGICDKKVISKKILFLKIIVPIILIICLIYYYLYRRKKAKERIETGQVIKFKHPKSGFYQINFEKYLSTNNNAFEEDFSQNKSLSSNTTESNENQSIEVNCCVACGSKKTYGIADCGCSLCYDDYKIAKGDKEKIKCKIHNVFLSSNISFEIFKSNLKGNAVEKLGLSKCPVCKINDGTQSFKCGCPMLLCEKCFNDNVYVFKYNQCPGCGMPYVPVNKIKKKKKTEEEKKTNE